MWVNTSLMSKPDSFVVRACASCSSYNICTCLVLVTHESLPAESESDRELGVRLA